MLKTPLLTVLVAALVFVVALPILATETPTPIPTAEVVDLAEAIEEVQVSEDVVSFDYFMEKVGAIVDEVLLGSSLAAGVAVMTLVNLLKFVPLPIFQNPEHPRYMDGPALQRAVGLVVVALFWVTQAMGYQEIFNQGYTFIEGLLPILLELIVFASGVFGWSLVSHESLKRAHVPVLGKSRT